MQTPATNVRFQVVLVSILMAFVLYLDRICLGEIVKSKSFLAETEFTKDQIGLLQASFFLTYAAMQIPAGWASDRFGGRRMLTGSIVAWSLLTILTAMSRNFFEMRLSRLAFGVAQAGAYPTSGGLIRNWFPVLARGKASAFVTFGGRLGGTLAPWLTSRLIPRLGSWRVVLGVYGMFGLVVAAAYWLFVRDRPTDCDYCNEAERELIGQRESDRPKLSEIPELLWSCTTSFSLWCNSFSQFMVNIGWAFLITWLPTYLTEVKQIDEMTGATMVSIVLAAGVIGQLLGGVLADFSIRRLGLRRGRSAPITAASFVAGLAYLSCLKIESAWGIVAMCVIVSLMTDLCNPSTWAFMQDIGGRNTAAVAGWGNMWGNFGAAFSAMMVPQLLKYFGSNAVGQQAVFLACSGAFFLSGLVALGMNPLHKLIVKTPPEHPTSPALT